MPNFPKKTSQVLQAWFQNNIEYPYPNFSEKESLRKETGLSMRQIQIWFTNARKV